MDGELVVPTRPHRSLALGCHHPLASHRIEPHRHVNIKQTIISALVLLVATSSCSTFRSTQRAHIKEGEASTLQFDSLHTHLSRMRATNIRLRMVATPQSTAVDAQKCPNFGTSLLPWTIVPPAAAETTRESKGEEREKRQEPAPIYIEFEISSHDTLAQIARRTQGSEEATRYKEQESKRTKAGYFGRLLLLCSAALLTLVGWGYIKYKE